MHYKYQQSELQSNYFWRGSVTSIFEINEQIFEIDMSVLNIASKISELARPIEFP